MKKMESPNDLVLQEDLENIALDYLLFDGLKDSTILVTGATGLVGSYLIKSIMCYNRINSANIKIIALIRDMGKAKKVFGDIYDSEMISFVIADIMDVIDINYKIDYIIHAASTTASKLFVTKPVETIDTIILGTKNILELARNKSVKGLVYLSSMEVYGVTNPGLENVSESDLGYIDILDIRSSYSEGKRMAECMCAAYANQYGINVKIARLAQTFGAGVDYTENRVFAQFAKSVINKTDIVLHTEGKSVGNYCYIGDTVKALILLLTKGESGQAYNISNEKSNITIKDMAYMVANNIANGDIKVKFDIPKSVYEYGYAPDVNMKLNSEKMRLLGWKPEISLEESYKRMIASMMQNGTK